MQLEILSRAPLKGSLQAPILFIHGVCHGAWCWQYWIDWFAERGRQVYAVSLRGHGKSDGKEALDEFGLQDYRDDVLKVAREIGQENTGRRPVLVGHSMGGAVAQLVMAAEPALFSGLVLLASLPPDSMRFLEILRMLINVRAHRALNKLMNGRTLAADETLSLVFFDQRLSREQAEQFGPLLQPESRRAQKELVSFRAPPVSSPLPKLVLGSARDSLFGRAALTRTARHFDADLLILEEGCHDVMLDPVWRDYAIKLDEWLALKVL
jgi:pimeloyl-ACP methyl ester carboxylesterase